MMSDSAIAYRAGLSDLLDHGQLVPSVRGAKSTASGFGQRDRPWIELTCRQFTVRSAQPRLISSATLPVHVPYCIGLLAWTLAGRNDVESLSYYRPAARAYSDDGVTLCGAFGHRMFGDDRPTSQLAAILDRLKEDPASRRTYAAIINPQDNVVETREYPCAAGVQLFVRNGRLDWLTTMRAQQALTVLPYDVFLFSTLQHFVASELGVDVGFYHHFCGTFHIYTDEQVAAQKVIDSPIDEVTFPQVPDGAGPEVAAELIRLEAEIRTAADADEAWSEPQIATSWEFNRVAARFLLDFAAQRRDAGATKTNDRTAE